MIYRHTRGCPVCGSRFKARRTQDYSYERCTACAGIWMSFPVLRLMITAMDDGAVPVFEARTGWESRRCPDCQEAMEKLDLFHIPVDACMARKHGVWFDKDELAQVLERVSTDEAAPPAPPSSFTSLLADFFAG